MPSAEHCSIDMRSASDSEISRMKIGRACDPVASVSDGLVDGHLLLKQRKGVQPCNMVASLICPHCQAILNIFGEYFQPIVAQYQYQSSTGVYFNDTFHPLRQIPQDEYTHRSQINIYQYFVVFEYLNKNEFVVNGKYGNCSQVTWSVAICSSVLASVTDTARIIVGSFIC